jgi:hypothetical protein
VIELYFHQELYDGFAVDEAVKAYAAFAAAELERKENGYVVRLTALPAVLDGGVDEQELAHELANYALGKTIERRETGAVS